MSRAATPIRRRVSRAAVATACGLVALLLGSATAAAVAPPDLGARAAALLDPSTGRLLYGVGADRELAIASTTKLMTALVTLEHVPDLSQMVASPPGYRAAAGDSQIGLVPGERMSVHDLLLAMLLPSADDAAVDLAYNVGQGSVAAFVAMMNAQARRLGLAHTHYSTPVGFDRPGNYSTASDLVRLAAYVLVREPFLAHAVALPRAVLHTGAYVRHVTNLDDLVARVPWIHGVKTGHTLHAGYVLVSAGTRGGMTLIGAVLGTPSAGARDQNALALLDYGFANFHRLTPVATGWTLASRPVKNEPGMRIGLRAGGTISRVLPVDARIAIRVQAPAELVGPIPRGTVVGSATVLAGGRAIGRIPVVVARAVPAVSSLELAARFLTRPTTLVVLVVLLGLAAAVSARRREHARGRASA